jgi:hypothetical protein
MPWTPEDSVVTRWVRLPAVQLTTEANVALTTEDGVSLAAEADTRPDPWTPVPITEA